MREKLLSFAICLSLVCSVVAQDQGSGTKSSPAKSKFLISQQVAKWQESLEQVGAFAQAGKFAEATNIATRNWRVKEKTSGCLISTPLIHS